MVRRSLKYLFVSSAAQQWLLSIQNSDVWF